MFSSRSFIVSAFRVRFMIHLHLALKDSVKVRFFPNRFIRFLQHNLLKKNPFPIKQWCFCWKWSNHICVCLFLSVLFCLSTCLSVCLMVTLPVSLKITVRTKPSSLSSWLMIMSKFSCSHWLLKDVLLGEICVNVMPNFLQLSCLCVWYRFARYS